MEPSIVAVKDELTVQLARLMVSRSRYAGSVTWLPNEKADGYRVYTPEFVQEVIALLKAGADRDLIVCAYLIDNRLYHNILSTSTDAELDNSLFDNIYGEKLPYPMHQMLLNLTHVITPLIDAAEQRDLEAISIYSLMGLRLDRIITRLDSHHIIPHHQRNPFLQALAHQRQDVVRKLLESIDPENWFFQAWLTEPLLMAIWPSLGRLQIFHWSNYCNIIEQAYRPIEFHSWRGFLIVWPAVRSRILTMRTMGNKNARSPSWTGCPFSDS